MQVQEATSKKEIEGKGIGWLYLGPGQVQPVRIQHRPDCNVLKKVSLFQEGMSPVEMVKLGKEIKQAPTTEVQLFKFELDQLCWSKCPSVVEFVIESDPFGRRGFRNAFKATSQAEEFQSTAWVVKKYLPQAIEDIGVTGQTVEQHTKKVVQMHILARHFAARLKQEIEKKRKWRILGEFLKYNKTYFGKFGEECVTLEEFIEGTFTKHINNTGDVCGDATSAICKKAECLAYYSFQQSEKKLMVYRVATTTYLTLKLPQWKAFQMASISFALETCH